MTDRELLELAAKAAGPEVFGSPGCYFRRVSENHSLVTGWNPLTDDGDALRLAVTLGIYIGKTADGLKRFAQLEPMEEAFYEAGDPYAATRRAIVRAAAEIGKAMDAR